MAASIQWLLGQTSLGTFKLLAGGTGVSNAISSVNIMDNPDTIRWLTEGELVLTTGYLFLENTWLRNNAIEELSRKRCAGIGFVLKRYMDTVPIEMVQQADLLGFPIISIPYELSLAQIVWTVYQKNFEEKMSETERLASIYKKFAEAVATESNLAQMLSDIVTMVGCPALVLDSDFRLIEYETPESHIDSIQHFLKIATDQPIFSQPVIHHIQANFLKKKLVSTSHLLTCGSNSMKCVLFPVMENQDILGYLCLCETMKELISFDYQFVQTILPVLSLYLMRRMMHSQLRIENKNEFIKLIMSQDIISPRELQLQCELYQFDYQRLRVCSVIQLTGYEGHSLRRRKEMIDTAYTLTAAYLNENQCSCYKLTFQNNLILFFMYSEQEDRASALENARAHTQCLLNRLGNEGIVAHGGMGKAYCRVDTIRLSLRQAFEAIQLGSKLKPGQKLYSYFEDQIYHIFSKSLDKRQAKEIFDETLGRLEQYDQQTGQELCQTAKVFFKNQLSTTETAKELFLHRNTMFYRLEKIKDVLGKDPRDLEVSFGLLMGFYARELLSSGLLDDNEESSEWSTDTIKI